MSHQLLRKILDKSYILPRFLHGVAAVPATNSSAPSASEPKPCKSDEPIAIKNPYQKDKTQCILCRLNLEPNYKNVRLLSQFQSSYTGRIYGRHITGLCRMQQSLVTREIKRAQDSGHMPVYNKMPEFLRDPKLFDPERPLRPHKY